jgi:transcriptional regulator with XRE-family HTH domain
MPTRIRTRLAQEAERANREQLAQAGRIVRTARIRRHLSQATLGDRVGLSQAAISRAERGHGGGLTLDTWQRVAIALGIPLRLTFQRDPLVDTADAGHLAMQEVLLRLGRRVGYGRTFELATKAAEPWRSIDVGLIDDGRRTLIVSECWNTFGDIGAAARVSTRKATEAEDLATARWGQVPHRVGLVWVVRATAANRASVARYPEVFATRFPGSSAAWVAALTTGSDPPTEHGLVWMDVAATRIFAWRRRP